ncbi:hypothetical protein HOT82_gp129 [Gordonia phage Ronaldo]|uniref:Uncharacterized protein n=2 Tax=Ronaldovirus ronaldo TaxID=2734270 RepID=A0A6B9L915_9CAUD|nr:hypothetical protein HOT82_gp129 [Gordonia phage Ronaldo]AXN53707.1 hypothetical protein SEA_RONALDO_146 [Gordonia phage Ronaldo]QHB38270.1 hypothetical protein SEA_VOLT_149 [Gordonia phage Volt]QTF81933.1 hypothetical protein SEA_GUEY18_148 [Gordonia phage Guey18]
MEIALVIGLFLILYFCARVQPTHYKGNRPIGRGTPNAKPPKGTGGVARGRGRSRRVGVGNNHVTHKGRSL